MEKKSGDLKRRKTIKSWMPARNHEPISEMHRAITMLDKQWVKRLLDKGDTLCYGVGNGIYSTNCFILAHTVGTWEFMKFLLSLDPESGAIAHNSESKTLLMLYAKNHGVKEVQLLLELGADPNARCKKDGSTALLLAVSKGSPPYVNKNSKRYDAAYIQRRHDYKVKCLKTIELLIEHGANVDTRNKNRENALQIAVKNRYTFHQEILECLINAGVDPTLEDKGRCTVLSHAMETIFIDLENDSLAKEMYPTLQYLFSLSAFQGDFKLRCDIDRHPQTILLKNLSVCQRLIGEKSIFSDLLASTVFCDPDLIYMDYLQNVRLVDQSHLPHCIKLPFGPLAVYLNHERYSGKSTSDRELSRFGRNIMENLQYLLSAGLGCGHETVSPLTVGLLHRYPHFNYVLFAKNMVNNGIHVEQRILKYVENDEELESLSAQLCLPDALRVALSQVHLTPAVTLELVKKFLPHFAHPGMTLLPFATPEKVDTLFQFLTSDGSLQHSYLHTMVQQRVLNSGWLSVEQAQIFKFINDFVPPLQTLCRTVIRAHLAFRASENGESLPEVIESMPPLLTASGNHLVSVSTFLK